MFSITYKPFRLHTDYSKEQDYNCPEVPSYMKGSPTAWQRKYGCIGRTTIGLPSITANFCLFLSEQIFSSTCREEVGEEKKRQKKHLKQFKHM